MSLQDDLKDDVTKTAIEEGLKFAIEQGVPKGVLLRFFDIIKTTIKPKEVYFAFLKNDLPTLFKTDIENVDILDNKKVKDIEVGKLFEMIKEVINDIPDDKKEIKQPSKLTDLTIVEKTQSEVMPKD